MGQECRKNTKCAKRHVTMARMGYFARMERRRLPVGIQTLGNIRARNCYYVDKTPHVLRLVEEGTHYFLSRPRRFGKSLLIDTLKELFEGNGELFRGLAIHGEWDWSVKHPVVRFDFSGGEFGDPDGVREEVSEQLEGMAAQAGVEVGRARPAILFRRLVRALRRQAGRQVAVLVDEYDKPILDALTVPEVARSNREFLRSLYGGIKDCDADIRFCFLTGVSKFSKAGLFSGLNNLRDITLDRRYGTICGYTDADLDTVFAPELGDLDRDEVRRRYNGYSWLGEGRVYNPFDILLLFDKRKFGNYWFETGTPAFLVDLLARRGIDALSLEGRVADDTLLSAFDIDEMSAEALLFQTGYLTITGEERDGDGFLYTLGYPNREVMRSLNAALLGAMAPGFAQVAERRNLRRLLLANDFAGVEGLFRAFLAGIPNEWYAKTGMEGYEAHYASVFYSHFAAAGMDVRVEESVSHGRADMAVLFNGNVYVFEFKMVDREPQGLALRQIRERGYADKYRDLGWPIHLIGVEFSREGRNIAAFTVGTA